MKQTNQKGVLNGLMSGVLWGGDTAFTSLILLMLPFTLVDPRLAAAPLLLAFFHDGFSAVMMTGELVRIGQLKPTLKQLRSKSALVVMLAALFGGPLGMRAYLYAVDAIGPGYTASISSVYPVVAAVLGTVILKEKLPWYRWLGLGIAVLAILGVSLNGSALDGGGQWIGFVAAGLCVLGWACESVICAVGMQEDISAKQALWIRQCVSTTAYLGFMIVESDVLFSVQSVLTQPALWAIMGVAVLGTLSYLNYYQAIDTIGPVKATGLNVSYSIWAIVFAIVLGQGQFDWVLLVCSGLMIVGCMLVSKN